MTGVMKKRILFVDDEQRVLDGLRRMLYSVSGEWDVEFALGGVKALSILETHPYDALVTDLRMPGMDGLALLKAAHPHHPTMIRLVLSAFAPRLTVFGVLPHAHGFLVKPCESAMLVGALSRRLALRDSMGTDRVRSMILGIDTLPLLPETLTRLTGLVHATHSSSDEVDDLVTSDPALTAELIRFSCFVIDRKPSAEVSASKALASVGRGEFREMLRAQIFRALPEAVVERCGVRNWATHGAAVAAATTENFRKAGSYADVPADVLLAGFVHDIGQWVLLRAEPEIYAEVWRKHQQSGVPLQEVEKSVFGATHAEIGGLLLGFWGLPDSIVEAVAHHHEPPGAGETPSKLRVAIRSADETVRHAAKQ